MLPGDLYRDDPSVRDHTTHVSAELVDQPNLGFY
jgi:hypothetical protein